MKHLIKEILKEEFFYKGVNPTVDLIVTRGDEILLIKRSANSDAEPNKWALPGGFHDSNAKRGEEWINNKETSLQAAKREVKEETGLEVDEIDGLKFYFVGTFEGGDRDPRDNEDSWTKSTVYKVDIPTEFGDNIKGMDDASKARWVPINVVLNSDLAFDHKDIIKKGLNQNLNESEDDWGWAKEIPGTKEFNEEYKYFEIIACYGVDYETEECDDEYSHFIRIPKNKADEIWYGYDGYMGGPGDEGAAVISYAIDNNLIPPRELEEIIMFEGVLEISEDSMRHRWDKEIMPRLTESKNKQNWTTSEVSNKLDTTARSSYRYFIDKLLKNIYGDTPPNIFIDGERSKINYANTNRKLATYFLNDLMVDKNLPIDQVYRLLFYRLKNKANDYLSPTGSKFHSVQKILGITSKAGDAREKIAVEILKGRLTQPAEFKLGGLGDKSDMDGVDILMTSGNKNYTFQVKPYENVDFIDDNIIINGVKGAKLYNDNVGFMFFVKNKNNYLIIHNKGFKLIDGETMATLNNNVYVNKA